jgi:integrase
LVAPLAQLAENFIRDLLQVTGGGRATSFVDLRDHAMIRMLTEGVRREELAQQQITDLSENLSARPFVRVVPLKGARDFSRSTGCGCRRQPEPTSSTWGWNAGTAPWSSPVRAARSSRSRSPRAPPGRSTWPSGSAPKARSSWLRTGGRLDRHCAARIVRRVTRHAGITKQVSPHTLRHAFITASFDAGVPLRDVQEAVPAAAWPTRDRDTDAAIAG